MSKPRTPRLHLVTRQDLVPGQQAVQAAHALREWTELHPELDRAWYKASNTLAFLAVADEAALGVLEAKARSRGIAVAPFREPDRGNELTALAIEPAGYKLCSSLRLALKAGLRDHSLAVQAPDSKSVSKVGSTPTGHARSIPHHHTMSPSPPAFDGIRVTCPWCDGPCTVATFDEAQLLHVTVLCQVCPLQGELVRVDGDWKESFVYATMYVARQIPGTPRQIAAYLSYDGREELGILGPGAAETILNVPVTNKALEVVGKDDYCPCALIVDMTRVPIPTAHERLSVD